MSSDLPPLPQNGASASASNLSAQWNQFRSNKTAFFAASGFVGAAIGDLLYEMIGNHDAKAFLEKVIAVSIWGAGIGGALAPALACAGAHYNRRQLSPKATMKMAWAGFLGGAASGALIEAFYEAGFALGISPGSGLAFIYQCLTWGLMGGMVGGILASTVPNLQQWRGVCSGGVGGSIGCAGFLALGSILPEVLGRLFGVGVMGLAIGLSIVVAEKLAREASLEVIWAPNEVTFSNLGEQPVLIGGGPEDHVFVRGFPAGYAGIAFSQGRVEYAETASGRRAPLNNGSRLEIGKLTLIVHTDVKG